MPAGRPTLPLSVKRARGSVNTTRESAKPYVGITVPALADPPPADLGPRGHAVWSRLAAAGHWLTEADYEALALASRLADLADLADAHYRQTADPAAARTVLGFLREFTSALARLGFDPSARARLGLAEVERASKLAKMMRRQPG